MRILDGGHLEAVKISEDEILAGCWDLWSRKMAEKLGPDHEDITEENCIAEWVSSHSMAWEIPEGNY